jgi:UvrD-like helicase C-terminal domain
VRLTASSFASWELDEISLAYAITIHKSQGSEFPAVVIPLATQHYMLLQRNLIYTGITRGKRLLVLIGQKKALGIAVRNDRPQRRYSGARESEKRRTEENCAERLDFVTILVGSTVAWRRGCAMREPRRRTVLEEPPCSRQNHDCDLWNM